MTTYKRSDRRHWRHTLRRVAWRVNLLLAGWLLALVLLASTGSASVATAAPACPGGVQPGPGGACVVRIDRRTICAWPFVVVRVGRTVLCTRVAPEVQP